MSPWLITTAALPSLTLDVVLASTRTLAHHAVLGTAAMAMLVVGCGVLMRLRARLRAGRRFRS